MKFNYQERDITEEKLREKIGDKIFNLVVKKSMGKQRAEFIIDIDLFRGGILVIERGVV